LFGIALERAPQRVLDEIRAVALGVDLGEVVEHRRLGPRLAR
jgi:hypothetical protein